MNSELQQKLFEKYPEIFRQKDLDKTVSAMCWGISCGDGWYDLIDCLCWQIKNRVENVNRRKKEDEEKLICEAVQVKEKFGGLCFYTYGGDEFIDGVISLAETLSYQTCSDCGKPSEKNDEHRGWIYTRCKECKDKHQ